MKIAVGENCSYEDIRRQLDALGYKPSEAFLDNNHNPAYVKSFVLWQGYYNTSVVEVKTIAITDLKDIKPWLGNKVVLTNFQDLIDEVREVDEDRVYSFIKKMDEILTQKVKSDPWSSRWTFCLESGEFQNVTETKAYYGAIKDYIGNEKNLVVKLVQHRDSFSIVFELTKG